MVAHARLEPRKLIRRATYGLLGLILLQGALGGLRVLLDKLNVGGEGNFQAVAFAVAHAVNAQLTIALLASVALSHTAGWISTPASAGASTRRLGRWSTGAVLGVILAGALMRQNRVTTWVSGGSPVDWFVPTQGEGTLWWFNFLHRSGAVAAALVVIAFAVALLRQGWRTGGAILALLALQLTLGILAIQLPQNPHARTIHLVSGAAFVLADRRGYAPRPPSRRRLGQPLTGLSRHRVALTFNLSAKTATTTACTHAPDPFPPPTWS